MKKTLLVVLLIISFILAGSVSALGEEDFFELVKTGTPDEVKKAIDAGADVNAQTTKETEGFGEVEGVTPLMYAANSNQNPEVIKVLLDAGADINTRTKKGYTPLMFAADWNQNPEVTKLLLEAGADVNARTEYGFTPLMRAARNQNHEVTKLLIDAGADVNARTEDGVTPLMNAAVSNKNPEVIRILLEAGADVNARTEYGFTPLMRAANSNQNPEVTKVLIDAGADVNARTEDGVTPLMWAVIVNQNPEVIKVLLDAGADVNVQDEYGFTPLMRAANSNQNPEVTKVLIDAGADVNARTEDGVTPLMWAANSNQNPEVIKVLLEAGADPLIADNAGKYPIDYTEEGTEKYKLLALEVEQKFSPSHQGEAFFPLHLNGKVAEEQRFTLEGEEYTAFRLLEWVDPDTGQENPDIPGPWVFLDSQGMPLRERRTIEQLSVIAQANDMMRRLGKNHFEELIAAQTDFLKKMMHLPFYTEALSLLGEIGGIAISISIVQTASEVVENSLSWLLPPGGLGGLEDIDEKSIEKALSSIPPSLFSQAAGEIAKDPENIVRSACYVLLLSSIEYRRVQLSMFDKGSLTTEEEAKQWFSLEQKAQALWTYTSDFLSKVEKLERPDWQVGLETFFKGMGKATSVTEIFVLFKELVEKVAESLGLADLLETIQRECTAPLPVTPRADYVEYNLKLCQAYDVHSKTMNVQSSSSWSVMLSWTEKVLGGGRLSDAIYENGLFVVVGEGGLVFTSRDGINWGWKRVRFSGSNIYSYVEPDFVGITYGNGLFVAVGERGQIVTSPDAVNWTLRSVDIGWMSHGRDVAYGNGLFVVIADDIILTSSDGNNWTKKYYHYENFQKIAFGNGLFVVVGERYSNGVILISRDGVNWQEINVGNFGVSKIGVTYNNGLFVVAGGKNIFTSRDGINWTKRNSEHYLGGIAYSDGIFVSMSERGDCILNSRDGIHWEEIELDSFWYVLNVTYCKDRFIAVGTGEKGGFILTSLGNIKWMKQEVGVNWLYEVTWSGDTFVAVGQEGIFSSSDRKEWKRLGLKNTTLYGVTYGNSLFVAVGEGETIVSRGGIDWVERGGVIFTSPDGVNWIKRNINAPLLYDVAYGNGVFVAMGKNIILTSQNGVDWKQQGGGEINTLRSIAYGNGLFVIVGDGTILTSPDGFHWTGRRTENWGNQQISYSNGLFFHRYSELSRSTFISSDGINWIPQQVPIPISSIAYGDNLLVAVNCEDEPWTIFTLHQGFDWTKEYVGTCLCDIVYGDGIFLAVGERGTILTGRKIVGEK